MDYPDPEDILDILFHCTSRQNNTRYTNPEVDALLESARVEQNTEARIATLPARRAHRSSRTPPGCPMFYDVAHILVKPYVTEFVYPPMVIERYRDVVVDR